MKGALSDAPFQASQPLEVGFSKQITHYPITRHLLPARRFFL